MDSVILKSLARLLLPLILICSLVMLLKGHNYPGGGFIAGLIAASAYILYAFAYGADLSRKKLPYNPSLLIASGLGVSWISSFLSLFLGKPILTGLWAFPLGIALGTPLLFDLGVLLVVLGVASMIVFAIMEQE